MSRGTEASMAHVDIVQDPVESVRTPLVKSMINLATSPDEVLPESTTEIVLIRIEELERRLVSLVNQSDAIYRNDILVPLVTTVFPELKGGDKEWTDPVQENTTAMLKILKNVNSTMHKLLNGNTMKEQLRNITNTTKNNGNTCNGVLWMTQGRSKNSFSGITTSISTPSRLDVSRCEKALRMLFKNVLEELENAQRTLKMLQDFVHHKSGPSGKGVREAKAIIVNGLEQCIDAVQRQKQLIMRSFSTAHVHPTTAMQTTNATKPYLNDIVRLRCLHRYCNTTNTDALNVPALDVTMVESVSGCILGCEPLLHLISFKLSVGQRKVSPLDPKEQSQLDEDVQELDLQEKELDSQTSPQPSPHTTTLKFGLLHGFDGEKDCHIHCVGTSNTEVFVHACEDSCLRVYHDYSNLLRKSDPTEKTSGQTSVETKASVVHTTEDLKNADAQFRFCNFKCNQQSTTPVNNEENKVESKLEPFQGEPNPSEDKPTPLEDAPNPSEDASLLAIQKDTISRSGCVYGCTVRSRGIGVVSNSECIPYCNGVVDEVLRRPAFYGYQVISSSVQHPASTKNWWLESCINSCQTTKFANK